MAERERERSFLAEGLGATKIIPSWNAYTTVDKPSRAEDTLLFPCYDGGVVSHAITLQVFVKHSG